MPQWRGWRFRNFWPASRMIILGVHPGYHDACACLYDDYGLLASVALERLTRRKIDGGRIPDEAIDECLGIAGLRRDDVDALVLGRGAFPASCYSHLPLDRAAEARVRVMLGREKPKSMEREMARYRRTDSEAMIRGGRLREAMRVRSDVPIRFFNHHYAHALPCLFHTDWDEALLYTADGGGDNVQYSHRLFRNGAIETLYGGDECFLEPMRIDSLGLAYGYATQALGFKINRHEGKLTGLAAYGQATLYDAMARHFRVEGDGQIRSDFESYPEMRRWMLDLAHGEPRENVAASIQLLLETCIIDSVAQLLKRTGSRHLGLAGGVFANVRLNRRLAEELPVDEVFVYPAMSDQGLACGGVLQFLLERDGLEAWLRNRWRLRTLYYGRDYGSAIDDALAAQSSFRRISDTSAETSAKLLAEGAVVAIYTRGMEYGPRALGARSILASPADPAINDRLNARLGRTEFMPFAPVVAEQDSSSVFDLGRVNSYAARFMTITCGVRPGWGDRIPAVVHVDGTARPQVVRREDNPLYYDILAGFRQRTGLPVLINTSFNVHEEPIINSPAECVRALADGRIDYVTTELGVYAGPAAGDEAG